MYTVVGIERKKGSMLDKVTGKEILWDRFDFHLMEVLEDENPQNVLKENNDLVGTRVLTEKGNYNDFVDSLPTVGEVYEIYYNKQGRLSKFVPA